MRSDATAAVLSLLFLIILAVVGFGGWVLNISKLLGTAQLDALSVLDIARAVGVFIAPLGVFLGWFF